MSFSANVCRFSRRSGVASNFLFLPLLSLRRTFIGCGGNLNAP
jgi:hypothetical protein